MKFWSGSRPQTFNPIDYQMRRGESESKLMRSPVLGREFSGTVIKVGPKAERFQVGDDVMGLAGSFGSNGTYAEMISIKETILALKPAAITHEEATAIPSSGLTAWETYTRAKISKEHNIFITGATGGVGRFLIKLLQHGQICNITASAGSEASAEALTKLGLSKTQIVDYNSADLEELLLKANNGQKYNHIAELEGGAISGSAAAVIKLHGKYLDVTSKSTSMAREILFGPGAEIINVAAYAYALENDHRWYGRTLDKIRVLIDSNSISAPDVSVLGTYQLRRLAKGMT